MAAFIAGVMIIVMNRAVDTFGAGVVTVLIGILASLLLGLAAGFVNGIIITRGKIAAFIVTLGTLRHLPFAGDLFCQRRHAGCDLRVEKRLRAGLFGVVFGRALPHLGVCGGCRGRQRRFTPDAFRALCLRDWLERVARYSAIRVDRIQTLTYVLQGLCVSLATIIYVPRLGSASASTGVLWELEAIAAVIIGGTALRGGSGHIWGTVVGAIMLSTIGNVLNLTGFISEYLNGAVQGVIIIAAVLLQRTRQDE